MATAITQLSEPIGLNLPSYESQDVNLIPSFETNTTLVSNSTIEFFVYDNNLNILHSEYNFKDYSVLNDGQSSLTNELAQITFDPEKNLTDLSFIQGEFITQYSFYNKQVGSDLQKLYISEISADRTELRLDSTILTPLDLIEQTNIFVNERENSQYFLDFYLNFGENKLALANNIVLDVTNESDPSILIKLYEPLPDEYLVNSMLWVVNSFEEPLSYQVKFEDEPIVFNDSQPIKGPNYNISIKDQINNSTNELTYADLISTQQSSSYYQINSLLEEKEIDINIDYTNFSNFIHFSSAKTRLENFYYKISLIEQYSSSISLLDNTTSSPTETINSKTVYSEKINSIITNFDGYDYFLYYTSGSQAWPKTTSVQPYELAKSNSPEVEAWIGSTNEYSPLYGGMVVTASLFDNTNPNNLIYSIPEYLREDPNNAPYELFINMLGQHYDNIWIYYSEVTQRYNADNRLEQGMSKDIVADAIRDFGIKLYQNNYSNEDLFSAFLGLTPQGSVFPFPNITSSLPTPSGYEYINTFISASTDNMPMDDVNKSLYKRLYHNIPYLLKSKGTLPGLRALITSYGIPDTILRINEYGGKDKVNSNDWDYWQNEFNYEFSTSGSNYISSSWDLNPEWNSANDVPETLMFRFKTYGLPKTGIQPSQSLWYGDGGSALSIIYTGSGYTSGSYSGSIIDPQYQYAHLTFYPNTNINTATASVYLPVYDGDWWSVMVTRNQNTFTLYAGSQPEGSGDNLTRINHLASSSITTTPSRWTSTNISYFPAAFDVRDPMGYDIAVYNVNVYDELGNISDSFTPFTGSYQEIRYYSDAIGVDVFKDYVMNPYSIEGNTLNSSPDVLAFRAPVGGELYLGTSSIHPRVTGSWDIVHSFNGHSDFYFDSTPHFLPNVEHIYVDQPIVGIKNAISDKIRVEDNVLPSGDTLSPFRVLSQQTDASSSYTPNINYLEVAFSPQNEINDDIASQIGSFNIGEYIGDPRLRSSSATTYPDLDTLRNSYFQKYTKNYNLVDFIRLIKFFDNSLFKMIRDFVPARTSLASGIVIKQHILERNKYSQPQLTYSDIELSGTVTPQWNDFQDGVMYDVNGGSAGMFNSFNTPTNTQQVWTESIQTLSGSVIRTHSTQDEFYNGELPGTNLTATTQSLHNPNSGHDPMLNNVEDTRVGTLFMDVDYSTMSQSGSNSPINFDLLISGSASKFPIPDSNYTTRRHREPRYDGVKNTSDRTNVWTTASYGTYGKTPSTDDLRTTVAYCESIKSSVPERLNTSTAFVKYLINQDGTVSTPNITPFSLQLNQGNFQTGERVFLATQNEIESSTFQGPDYNTNYREVVRGATRVEPILHNQSGSAPARWTGSIEFENRSAAVNNYTWNKSIQPNLDLGTYSYTNDSESATTDLTFGIDGMSLTLTEQMATDGVSLTWSVSLQIGNYDENFSFAPTQLKASIFRDGVFFTSIGTHTFSASDPFNYYYYSNKTFSTSYTFTPEYIRSNIGKTFTIYSAARGSEDTFGWTNPNWSLYSFSSVITQFPIPGEYPIIIIPSDIWEPTIYPSPSWGIKLKNTSDGNQLYNLYIANQTNPIWYFKGIDNSGYNEPSNQILTPWNIQRGDEFRFNNNPNYVYLVDYVVTGSTLEVFFDQNLNTSPAPFDINHYSITRYVDDASKILIKGFRPNNTTGPYILRPEFVVPELDKGIDEFIVDLTQKGLL